MNHSHEAIQEQLKKILASPGFSETKRLKAFLQYILRETLAGRGDRINAYTVAIDVFERDENFNPQTDTIVRVQAGQLRRRLEFYYLTEGVDDAVKITLPKGGYTPRFEAQGGPQERLQKTAKSINGQHVANERISIAVSAFTNINAEVLDGGFSAGLTDEIVTRLTRFRDLLVTSNRTKKIQSDSMEGVDARFVLDGMVQACQQSVKVSAHLTETSTGALLWGDSYRVLREPTKFLEIQEDIASRLVARVAQANGVIARHNFKMAKSSTPEQLDLNHAVLCANHYLSELTPDKHMTARQQLENALVKEPEYTEAWALLAWVYADEYRYGYNPKGEPVSHLDRALKAAKKAVNLDPENCMAWIGLCTTYFARKELTQFRNTGDKAIALNPDAPNILADYGSHLAFTGDWEKGLSLVEKAISLNPNPPGWYYYPQTFSYYLNQQYALALDKANEIEGTEFYWNPMIKAMIYGQLGMTAEADGAISNLLALRPDIGSGVEEEWRKGNFEGAAVQHFLNGLRKAGLEVR